MRWALLCLLLAGCVTEQPTKMGMPPTFGACASVQEMRRLLGGESVKWRGLSQRGVVIRLWDDPNGAWTLTFENASQATCMLDAGNASTMFR